MSRSITVILDRPIDLVLAAVADGRVTAEEGREIVLALVDVALDEARPAIERAVDELVEFVGDLLHPDPRALRILADEAEADGRHRRAERLRARADRIEARRS